jgi:hypothetical protein
MFALGYILVLMLGATIGFVLACVIAARRVAYLSREGQLLQEKLEQYQNSFGVAEDQNQVNTTPLFLQVEFPQTQG